MAIILAIHHKDLKDHIKTSLAIRDHTDHHHPKAIPQTLELHKATTTAVFPQPQLLVHQTPTSIPMQDNTRLADIHLDHLANKEQAINMDHLLQEDKLQVPIHHKVPEDLQDHQWDMATGNTEALVQDQMHMDKLQDHQPHPEATQVVIHHNNNTNHRRLVIRHRLTNRQLPVLDHLNNNNSLKALLPPGTHLLATTTNRVLDHNNLRRPTMPTDHQTQLRHQTLVILTLRHPPISRRTLVPQADHHPDLLPTNPFHHLHLTNRDTDNNLLRHPNSNQLPTNSPLQFQPHPVQLPAATSRQLTSSPIHRLHHLAANHTLHYHQVLRVHRDHHLVRRDLTADMAAINQF